MAFILIVLVVLTVSLPLMSTLLLAFSLGAVITLMSGW